MNKILVVALSLLLSVFPFGCDDKKEEKEQPPVAGEVMAGEEIPDMMMEEEEPCELEEGCEEVDSEMPEAGEEMIPEAGAEG